ncbi:hypothetical protein, partial [uncultured Veillonella sp.]|uniref:hypothetical protein n=1 Tax=uncultured Veillonella sp. TaxID=159268 RepID=UPI002592F097
MNILKGILHRFNKKTNEYDTIHPETEVSQITDFNKGIIDTLASTLIGSLVTELSSDSLISKIVDKVLQVSGVRYSLGETGYIILGKFFGNFCIQWIKKDVSTITKYVLFPISFTALGGVGGEINLKDWTDKR